MANPICPKTERAGPFDRERRNGRSLQAELHYVNTNWHIHIETITLAFVRPVVVSYFLEPRARRDLIWLTLYGDFHCHEIPEAYYTRGLPILRKSRRSLK